MYIFSFKSPEFRYITTDYTYRKYGNRASNVRGAFNLRYLNSKINKSNYSILPLGSHELHKILARNGLYNSDIFGNWLVTESSEHAMYLRLGIEDTLNPRYKFQFIKGFNIDMDSVISEIKDKELKIREASQESSQIYRIGSIYRNLANSISNTRGIRISDFRVNLTEDEYNDIQKDLSSIGEVNDPIVIKYIEKTNNCALKQKELDSSMNQYKNDIVNIINSKSMLV